MTNTRFGFANFFAVVVTAAGFLGIVGGVLMLFIDDIPTVVAASAVLSSLLIVLAAQVVFILLAIERNTRPAAVEAEIQSAADAVTM